MKLRLNENLPALVPTYPVNIAGQKLTLRFDVNLNKTKKGVKLQFVLSDPPEDVRELQKLANEIGTELQKKFGDAGLQIMYDTENPYNNVVGFLLPLPSLADHLVKTVIKSGGGTTSTAPTQPEEKPKEKLPSEPLAERIKLIDII